MTHGKSPLTTTEGYPRLRLFFRRPLFRWGTVALLLAVTITIVLHFLEQKQPEPSPQKIYIARSQPLVSRLRVVGTVEPGAAINIAAPFDGTIKEKRFDFGCQVDKGSVLVVMDTTDIEVKLREAQVALLRATKTLDELKDWKNSADVSRAKRTVLASKLALAENQRKEAETRILLDRGIVPRQEWDSLQQQVRTSQIQLEASEQDLKNTLEKGSKTNLDIANLEFINTQSKLTEIKSQLENFSISAPVRGVILRPLEKNTANQTSIPTAEVGTHVSRGQSLFIIAALEHLVIEAKIDEVDVTRLKEGQAVDVTGEAFGTTPLIGYISYISAQASPTSAGSEASFSIKVKVTPTDEQMKRIRVGMSSVLTIKLYDNPHALIIPHSAIHKDGTIFIVTTIDAETKHLQKTPVIIGNSSEDGIEVIEGLKESDQVLLP